MAGIRVIVVSDRAVVVEGLTSLLHRSGIGMLGSGFSNCSDLLAKVGDEDPDVILLDWGPEWDFKLLLEISSRAPRVRVVLMARNPTPELIYRAQEAGACGVLDTTSSANEISGFIRNTHREEWTFGCSMTSTLPTSRTIRLTPREGQLVSLLSQGLKNKEIAAYLGITEGTVKVYLSKLFQKVGAKDRFEIALFGLKNMVNIDPSSRQPRPPASATEIWPLPALRSLVVRHSERLEPLAG